MSKASHSSSKKRMKEFAMLDKQKNQQGQKGPNAGKTASGGSGTVRTKTAPTIQRKTGI
jgi:hypothetical protein